MSTKLLLRESLYKRWKHYSKSGRTERTRWHGLNTSFWCLGLSQPGVGLPWLPPHPRALTLAIGAELFSGFPLLFQENATSLPRPPETSTIWLLPIPQAPPSHPLSITTLQPHWPLGNMQSLSYLQPFVLAHSAERAPLPTFHMAAASLFF